MYLCVCLVIVLLSIFDFLLAIDHRKFWSRSPPWRPRILRRWSSSAWHVSWGLCLWGSCLHLGGQPGRSEDGLQLLWKTEIGMGLILAKRKCNSGSVCLESLTDAEFFLNLRDMSTWKKYTNSYNYCSLQATRILFIRFYKKHWRTLEVTLDHQRLWCMYCINLHDAYHMQLCVEIQSPTEKINVSILVGSQHPPPFRTMPTRAIIFSYFSESLSMMARISWLIGFMTYFGFGGRP